TESNRRATVIGEDQKRRARRPENSVIGNSVHNRAHAVLANTEADVAAARRFAGEIAAVLDVVQCRSVQIRTAANQNRHRPRDWLKGFAAGFAGRQLRVPWKLRNLR